jgi:hypothetical protein
MQPAVRTVLALAEIKAAIEDFESGEANARETLIRIKEACKVAGYPVAERGAA